MDYLPVGCLLQHLTTRFPDDWSFDIVVATNVHYFLYVNSEFLADFHTGQFGVSRLCRLAAPGMMKMESDFGILGLEAGVG